MTSQSRGKAISTRRCAVAAARSPLLDDAPFVALASDCLKARGGGGGGARGRGGRRGDMAWRGAAWCGAPNADPVLAPHAGAAAPDPVPAPNPGAAWCVAPKLKPDPVLPPNPGAAWCGTPKVNAHPVLAPNAGAAPKENGEGPHASPTSSTEVTLALPLYVSSTTTWTNPATVGASGAAGNVCRWWVCAEVNAAIRGAHEMHDAAGKATVLIFNLWSDDHILLFLLVK